MSKTLKVPVQSIKDAADDIKRFADDNCDMFKTIIKLVKDVESCGDWEGKSVKALIDASQRNEKKFKTALDDMLKLASFLDDYAKALETADKDIKTDIQKVLGR